jgi:hypothetical protein
VRRTSSSISELYGKPEQVRRTDIHLDSHSMQTCITVNTRQTLIYTCEPYPVNEKING